MGHSWTHDGRCAGRQRVVPAGDWHPLCWPWLVAQLPHLNASQATVVSGSPAIGWKCMTTYDLVQVVEESAFRAIHPAPPVRVGRVEHAVQPGEVAAFMLQLLSAKRDDECNAVAGHSEFTHLHGQPATIKSMESSPFNPTAACSALKMSGCACEPAGARTKHDSVRRARRRTVMFHEHVLLIFDQRRWFGKSCASTALTARSRTSAS